jgi:hypothetical protein
MQDPKKSYLIPYEILMKYIKGPGEKMSVKLLVQLYAELSHSKQKTEKEVIEDFIKELDLYLLQVLEENK